MIERFNFYDLYGNLIPGLIFLGVILLPYGIVTQHWPTAELADVATVLVVAYLVGHVLQALATNALSSEVMKDQNGRRAYPSVVLLDKSDPTLAPRLKKLVAEKVKARFDIELRIDLDLSSGDGHGDIARVRNAAFFLCRPLANKVTSYGEQFQGLYAMSRGLFVALMLGVAYDAGVWLGSAYGPAIARILPAAVALALLLAFARLTGLTFVLRLVGLRTMSASDKTLDRITLFALAAVVFAGGGLLATVLAPTENENWAFVGLAALSLFCALRFLVLYRVFSIEFAKAVWTYFSVSDQSQAVDAA